MYEARQYKDRVSRRIDGSGLARQNRTIGLIQRLREKVKNYDELIRNQTVLYATLNGEAVGDNEGVFVSTGSQNHAEDNLLNTLRDKKVNGGNLIIFLSSSPCSSILGTKKGEGEGCMEKLEALENDGFHVEIHADHLYQPQELRQVEAQNGFNSGYCSASSAAVSPIAMDFSHIPKTFVGALKHNGESVAQLITYENLHNPLSLHSVNTER